MRQAGLGESKLTYAVVFEKAPNNYCADVPDVPWCVSVGGT